MDRNDVRLINRKDIVNGLEQIGLPPNTEAPSVKADVAADGRLLEMPLRVLRW